MLLFLGVLADLFSVFGRGWISDVVSIDVLSWFAIALSFVLTGMVVYVLWRGGRRERALVAVIEGRDAYAHELITTELSLSRRFTRVLESLVLDHIPAPPPRDILEPMLNELAKRLPDGGVRFKLSVTRPLMDGSFNVLAERGMDPSSVSVIEKQANWQVGRSFFANALNAEDDSPFYIYHTGETGYVDLQRPRGKGERPSSSGCHLIVPLRDPVHYESFPRNTLALVSVGIPKGEEYLADSGGPEGQRFFDRLFPIVRLIEALLLTSVMVEKHSVVALPSNSEGEVEVGQESARSGDSSEDLG